jgi:uncharacterized membrane protein (DUF4010 family)
MAGADAWIAVDGWRLIIVAALANLVFKAGIASLLGYRLLAARVALMFSVPLIGGVLLLMFWQ